MPKVKFVLNGQLKQLEENWGLLENDDPEVEDNMKAPVKWFNPTGAGTWIGLAKKPGEPIIYGYARAYPRMGAWLFQYRRITSVSRLTVQITN